MVNCLDVTYGREGENYAISEGWGGLVGVVCIIVKLILNINFFLKQNMAFRQNFIYKVKGIFAVSVLFCSRTSSALITTRPEVLPSLHRVLFTSRHGHPPLHGTAHGAECPMRTGETLLYGSWWSSLLPCAILCFRKWAKCGEGQRRLTI